MRPSRRAWRSRRERESFRLRFSCILKGEMEGWRGTASRDWEG